MRNFLVSLIFSILCFVIQARQGPDHVLCVQAFDPEQDLFDQISGIKARVALGLGSSTFAGISIVTGQLLSQLPTSRAALSKPGYLKQLTQLVHSLYRLVQAAAMTVADAMVFRSEPLSVLMQQLNIDVSSKAAAASAANDLVIPDFVLDLQVRAGHAPTKYITK